VRRVRVLFIVAAAISVAQGYAVRNGAALAAEQSPVTSEDDAACRQQGAPGTRAYGDCRRALAETHEQQKAIIQEQKRRDFDRLLGEGTGGFDETF
jgi:hypothetical protein